MTNTVCVLVAIIAAPALAFGAMQQAGAAQEKPKPPVAQEKAQKPDEAPKPAEVKLVEVVPDLPDYPSAVMASSKEKGPSDGWTHSWERETRTTASFDDVKKFYLEQIEKKGWRITARKEKPGKGEWALAKGSAWGRVKVEASSGITKITAEWKNR